MVCRSKRGAVSPSTWRHLARTSDAVALGSFDEEEDAARGVMGRGDRPIVCATHH
jgi:hypothetical protein